ncbi:multisubunit sodium/proton antiporter, MrpF subunit (TC 2.A.63.1) [Kaistia soli DSM 19436]|uniref:Multisubunit sodium/proton antiporter, MrpF subunit (TC 2.A.63.1) n=1 Tax=Kaistia soli DSM 19436 TaxID=1122133 RepID=A0A1M5GF74_9HYPH|nr:monovalent cation/H+ antiporter complex subunit F [Kaistia soli]SHG02346.1 multisubunit sodium/proton antiporter, MrpF subunit (TC 2.A.63.1) [Kaistia soli DSM 19436]
MVDTLTVSAVIVLAIVAVGLVRVLRGPSRIDRMMAVQLLGSGGVAVLVLLAVGSGTEALVDAALTLALLAAFASIALATTLVQKADLAAKADRAPGKPES